MQYTATAIKVIFGVEGDPQEITLDRDPTNLNPEDEFLDEKGVLWHVRERRGSILLIQKVIGDDV